MARKLPWMPFYTRDWIADTRVLSLEARALWIDILCLMHDSVRRGHLVSPAGLPLSIEQLASFAGCSVETAARGHQELVTAGVASCTGERILFSRRMVADEQKRKLCYEAGKRGGNPTLKGGVKGRVKGRLKPTYDSDSVLSSESFEEGKENILSAATLNREQKDTIARRIVDYYQSVVKPAHDKSRGVTNVCTLLRKGLSEEQLFRCADGYSAKVKKNAVEPQYRMAVGNFYGKAATYEEFLTWIPEKRPEDMTEEERLEYGRKKY